MSAWEAVGAIGSVAAAGVAAWAARQSRESADRANAAAIALAEIEKDRRNSELCPHFKVTCGQWGPGIDALRLKVMLLGPPGLDCLDELTVTIRDDHFRRAEFAPEHGRTAEEIARQIWGPYQFRPSTGPDHARADELGRTTVYDHPIPVGEELVFVLDPTRPPPWAREWGLTQDSWQTLQPVLIRLSLKGRRGGYEPWTLPCVVDATDLSEPVTVLVPAPSGR